MKTEFIEKVLLILDQTYPTLAMHEVHGHDPFQMLIAVVLSQRARDSVTVPTAQKLFEKFPTPQAFVDAQLTDIEEIIRPIGFSHEKALSIQALSQMLVDKFEGKVPNTEEELLKLPRVGRKTANIILTAFFDTPKIAVDVHVHRITNRLGWVQTYKPEQTEVELTKLIPTDLHSIVNRVFVAHGQSCCLPRHPHCTRCPIEKYCAKAGVE